MASFNQCTFIGHAGRDCEMNYTPAGKAVSKFSLAVNDYVGKDDQGKAKEVTTWLNIVAWDKLAEIANQYVVKGTQVLISGRLSMREYTDKTGVKRQAVEIIAQDIRLLGSKQKSEQAGAGTSAGDEYDPLADVDDHPF
jgi:single-strand DNA-binding protein